MKNILTLIVIIIGYCSQAFSISLTNTLPKEGQTEVSTSGNIVLTYSQPIMIGSAQVTLNSELCQVTIINNIALIKYAGLEFATKYTLNIPKGAFKGVNDKTENENTVLSFTTKSKPAVTRKVVDFIVDQNASPIYGKRGKTINSAIEFMPVNSATRYYIYIKKGIYNEILTIPENIKNISFIGQSKDSVIIANTACPVVNIQGQHIYMENLTIKNMVNPDVELYSIACYAEGKNNIYKNVKFSGHQDTKRTGGDRHYYANCDIKGTIDFIYGSGANFYDSCNIYLEKRNLMMQNSKTWDTVAVVVAGSHDSNAKYGYVFNNCCIDGHKSNANRYSLGRPWHNAPRAVFINTTMKILPFQYGWTSMGSTPPALYAEYNSKDVYGNTIDLSKRHASFICGNDTITAKYNPVLSDSAAKEYSLEKVLSGNDAWKPDRLSKRPLTPSVKLDQDGENKIIWNKNPECICYLVLKDKQPFAFFTDTSFTAEADGQYSVQAISEYGVTSPESKTTTIKTTSNKNVYYQEISVLVKNSILEIDTYTQNQLPVHIYDISGMLVKQLKTINGKATTLLPKKGFYIIKINKNTGAYVIKT